MALEVEQLARIKDVVCVQSGTVVGEIAEMMEQNVQGRETRHGLVIEPVLEKKKQKGQ